MAFTFPVDVHELILERASQWIGIGVPAQVIADVQSRVVDMWLDGPGGWANEWSSAASESERAGDLLQASLLYGIAKFPSWPVNPIARPTTTSCAPICRLPTVSMSASNAIWSM
jgi:hypothetical protein